jgi:histone arginine demethylase JMJD6
VWFSNSSFVPLPLSAPPPRPGEHRFKVGTDDEDYPVRLKFKYFYQYVNDPREMRDDSPLYVFDGTFASRSTSRGLLGGYTVPRFFQEDLFQVRALLCGVDNP